MHCISFVRSVYFIIFSASFLITLIIILLILCIANPGGRAV
jgi:hypothetical protein